MWTSSNHRHRGAVATAPHWPSLRTRTRLLMQTSTTYKIMRRALWTATARSLRRFNSSLLVMASSIAAISAVDSVFARKQMSSTCSLLCTPQP